MSRRFRPDAHYRIFLDLLIQAREERSLTREELANRLDLSPIQITALELGQRQIDFVLTMEWCDALDIPFLGFMIQLDAAISNAPVEQTDEPTDADPTQGGAK